MFLFPFAVEITLINFASAINLIIWGLLIEALLVAMILNNIFNSIIICILIYNIIQLLNGEVS